MSAAHRAATWEISESEDECDNGPETDSVVVIKPPPTPASQTPASLAPGTGGVRRGSRRVPGAREEQREAREEQREAREEQREARAREKEERKREQQKRKELAEHMKSLRPENCLKSLTTCIDPAVLEHYGSDILIDSLSASGWRFVIDSQALPRSVSWIRQLTQPGEDGRGFVEEEQVSWVLDLADFIDVAISVKEILRGNEDPTGGTLLAVLLEFLNRSANKVVTMLVIGSEINSATAWSGPSLQAQIGMEDLDMEEVTVYLQVYGNVSLSFFRDWRDVTDHLVAVTKALAKRPSRLLTERAVLPFCVDGAWASGSRVEKDGSGLRQVWSRQVRQLNRVSVAVATAVTAAYPSPRLLLQAYRGLGSEELRRKLLAQLPVTVEGKERRVGPDISSRIYRCLSEDNPEMGLD